ncbi:hypothetical protein CcrC1_gp404 [Caulobacter phage C1]|nr:hypothetical protein CcrC1_gp404 [Caulobacter phage C1]UTU08633.1 hypothetical protein CcrC2_gp405 [Caulobacter phage C2]UTU09148.1 hypothetical protein CcrJ4_gp399 [Caulobacter phage J4]UTU10265.1 hypothetical protein CcrRB23_gp403 [Caulobacter phage RB23]WGN97299.1 hypothetical protein [Bertelyvirus sp.]
MTQYIYLLIANDRYNDMGEWHPLVAFERSEDAMLLWAEFCALACDPVFEDWAGRAVNIPFAIPSWEERKPVLLKRLGSFLTQDEIDWIRPSDLFFEILKVRKYP